MTTREELLAQLDELQTWFAARPYGWRERATPELLRQWADREREEEYLLGRLEQIKG